MENWIEYRKAKALVRKITRKKRRESFIEFAEKLNKNFSLKYVWNKMKVLKNRENTQKWNKWKGVDRGEAIKEVEKIGVPWANEEIKEDSFKMLELENSKDLLMKEMNKEFGLEELNRAIDNCKDKSSPGVDEIEYKMIKDLEKRHRLILLDLFNYLFLSGYLYKDWKINQIIFIDKGCGGTPQYWN